MLDWSDRDVLLPGELMGGFVPDRRVRRTGEAQEVIVSTSSDLRDILRRHSVGSRAELTVEATTAAMAIRAAASHHGYVPRPTHLGALRKMLSRLDEVATYKSKGLLPDFVRDDLVARESLELVQVMARAAHQDEEPSRSGDGGKTEYEFPLLARLIESRDAIQVTDEQILIEDTDRAVGLAQELETLASEVLSEAIAEDRTRTSSYAVH